MTAKVNASIVCLWIVVIVSLSSLNAQERSPSPALTVVYTFLGLADGALPYAGVVRDGAGNLYGTGSAGGVPNNLGTAFKVDTRQHLTLLHSFGGSSDGYDPFGGLIRDSNGVLYGATALGGTQSYGTVYKLTPPATICRTALCPWNENNLYSFGSMSGDGLEGTSALLRDSQGNLYGTTNAGGGSGCGTVFKVDSRGNETALYSFTGPDGCAPFYGALIQDEAASLYGTTRDGGANNSGVVFKLDSGGHETVLYSLAGGVDGASPYAGVVADAAGNL